MSPDLLRALAELLWPVIVSVALALLYPVIREVIRSKAFVIKVGGMEISVQEASEQLKAQIADLRTKLTEIRGTLDREEVAAVSTAPSDSRQVLWVDDVPSNNAYAIAQLQDAGYDVLQARSTSDALQTLERASRSIAVVLSDMGRKEAGTVRPQAGLELLRAMRAAEHRQPFLICTTTKAADRYHSEVQTEGGSGATASLVEVFEFVRMATAGIP